MLKVSNVTLKFGGLVANNDVSFHVEKGRIFGLIGPNGAGKTTLFNVVSGVYKPTSGDVRFDGTDITGWLPHKINYRGIARTYQNINLFKKMSVLENVMVGCHSQSTSGALSSMLHLPSQRREEQRVRQESHAILELMGLADVVDAPAASLSYGRQRRLEISRALASKPKMLLLDEPAAGMNTSEKVELTEDIRKINETGINKLSPNKIAALGLAHFLEGRHVFTQLTVRENLMMGAYLCKDVATRNRNLAYVFELFPRLLEREAQQAGTLSGGEQQMLAVGRALMQEPKVLMMDEPSLGLAPIIVQGIFEIIKRIHRDGTPVLLVEQNSKAALAISDRGYVLETGNIVLTDTAAALMDNDEVRKAYLGG